MKNKISVIFILLAGAFWGSSCLFVSKLSTLGFTPLQCTAIRIVFGALILNSALIIKGRGLKYYRISLSSLALAAASGICSVLAMCVFYYYCMTMAGAAVSAILLYTAPIFVMIMSVIFFKERMTVRKIAAFTVAIAGCALVSGIASGVSINALGILCGVLSGFAYSLYGILTSFYMRRNSEPLSFSALSFAFAAVGSLVLSNPVDIVIKAVNAESIPIVPLVLLFMLFSLCTSVIPYVLYTAGLTGVRPDVASILAFSEPLTAALFGIAVLRQPFDIWQGLGIALVVTAIVILNISPKGKKT